MRSFVIALALLGLGPIAAQAQTCGELIDLRDSSLSQLLAASLLLIDSSIKKQLPQFARNNLLK